MYLTTIINQKQIALNYIKIIEYKPKHQQLKEITKKPTVGVSFSRSVSKNKGYACTLSPGTMC